MELVGITTVYLPQYGGKEGLIRVSPTSNTELGSYTIRLIAIDRNPAPALFFTEVVIEVSANFEGVKTTKLLEVTGLTL